MEQADGINMPSPTGLRSLSLRPGIFVPSFRIPPRRRWSLTQPDKSQETFCDPLAFLCRYSCPLTPRSHQHDVVRRKIHRDFFFPGTGTEFMPSVVSLDPDLVQKIPISITVEDELGLAGGVA